MLRRLALLTLLTITAGCATHVAPSATVKDVAGKAVVVFSISHDNGYGFKAIAYIDSDSLATQINTQSASDMIPSGDFKDRKGQLYVIDVEPGMHAFTTWQVPSAGFRIFPRVKPPALTFEAKAGEVIYLGNIHFRFSHARGGLFGMSPGGAAPSVVDRSDQDIPLAEEKVPALKGRVTPALLPLGPWSVAAGTVTRSDPIAVPPPLKR